MEIGTVKQVTIDADGLDCVVTLAGDVEVTATIYGLPGVECYPLPGDEVKISWCGGSYVIDAVFRAKHADLGEGETILYGRDGSGVVVSTVHAKADGTVVLNGGTESAVKGDTMKSTYDVHTHSTAFGPSGPPAVAYPSAGLNNTVKV